MQYKRLEMVLMLEFGNLSPPSSPLLQSPASLEGTKTKPATHWMRWRTWANWTWIVIRYIPSVGCHRWSFPGLAVCGHHVVSSISAFLTPPNANYWLELYLKSLLIRKVAGARSFVYHLHLINTVWTWMTLGPAQKIRDSKTLRPEHEAMPVLGLPSECRASGWVTLTAHGWFEGMYRIPPPGQQDEMSGRSQGFQSCHVKTNWLPQQHLKCP